MRARIERISAVGRRAGAAALALALLAGCGGGTTTVEAASTPEAVAVDDAYHPDLVRYFRDWCCGRGSEFSPGPGTIEAGLKWAGVVVLAGIGDVHHGYLSHHAPCTPTRPNVPFCGVAEASNLLELTGVQVLAGSLPPGVTDLVVGRGGQVTAADPDGTKSLRAELPKGGQAVWFLTAPQAPPTKDPSPPPGSVAPPAARAGGSTADDPHGAVDPYVTTPGPGATEYYRVAHHVLDMRATFVQGPDGVLAPMAMEDDPAYLGEESVLGLAARYATLSELVADIGATAGA